MLYIWEEKDIDGGRKYSRAKGEEVWMIGWQTVQYGEIGAHQVLFSVSMSDGMVIQHGSKSEMAEYLTVNKYIAVEFL